MSDTPSQGADADPVVPEDGGPQAPDEVFVSDGEDGEEGVDDSIEEQDVDPGAE